MLPTGPRQSRFQEGGGAKNRIDTLARVATALDLHLVLSFPVEVPDKLTDAVQPKPLVTPNVLKTVSAVS